MKNWNGLMKNCLRNRSPNFQVGNAREAATRIAPQTRGGTFGGTARGGESGIDADRMVRVGGFVNASNVLQIEREIERISRTQPWIDTTRIHKPEDIKL